MQTAKFIFVTGGVMSGLGKGITASSIAKLLQLDNYKTSCVKIDPYLNYDAGTMNPVAHGEVYVTEDGGECDMDLGNYERFLNQDMPKSHNITTAQVYSSVINDEREGKYLGACVQIIPHVTDEIKRRLYEIIEKEKLDILVVECGGTVGDIESLPFLEAMRQIRFEEGMQNSVFIHVTLAPILDVVGEQKSKPTQHSVQELRKIGIQPDYLAVRCKESLHENVKKKIALFSNVEEKDVLSCHDVESVFQVPQLLHKQGLTESIFKRFKQVNNRDLKKWEEWNGITDAMTKEYKQVKIALVGKYVSLIDSYVSVNQALSHACSSCDRMIKLDFIDSETIQDLNILAKYDGVVIPGGFGVRGSEGIINTAQYCMEKKIPYLGICFGFQLAIVAFGRKYCNLTDGNSTEIDKNTDHKIIDILPEQNGVTDMGGSLRLGGSQIKIKTDSRAQRIYGKEIIQKRHRHRYEFNTKYDDLFTKNGMIFSGNSMDGKRMEILEITDHPFFFATQFHPEFNSRPGYPEESFVEFIKIASN